MPTQAVSGRIRLGILVLPVGAVLILAGTVIYGPGPESPDDLRAYAEIASSSRTAVSNFLWAVGQLLLIFAFVALYACMASGRAERWAFFAMVLCVPGIASAYAYSVGTSGPEAVAAEQYLQGQQAVLEEWYGLFDWSSIFSFILNPGLFSIGLILFGVAIWRSQALPQGAAILWFAVVLFQLGAPLTWWATVVSFLLLTIAGGWIAWTVWRQPSSHVAGRDAQARVQ
jgi:hypothetical protein